MKNKLMLAIALGMFFFLPRVGFGGESVLSTAGKILQISPGARAVGMGEANVAATDDLYSSYWNPAGLINVNTPQLSYMHNLWLQDIQDAYITYAQRLFGGGGAVSVNYFNFGTMEKIDVDPAGFPLPTDKTFTPYSLVLTAAYGTRLLKDLDIGASIKLISENVDTFSSMSLAMDLGAQFSMLEDLTGGVLVQNLGLPMEGYQLPLNVKAGLAYQLPMVMHKKDRFLLVADASLPIPLDQPFYINAGLEYSYLGIVAIRGGYKISEINQLGSMSGLTAGFGVNYAGIGVDYAVAPFGELGLTHRIGVTYTFDSGKKVKKAKRKRAIKRSKNVAAPATGVMLPPGQTGGSDTLLLPKVAPIAMRKDVQVNIETWVNPKISTTVDRADFDIRIASDKETSAWALKITDANDNAVITYSGTGELPESISWPGKDQGGKIVRESIFCKYALNVEFSDGSKETVNGKLVAEEQSKEKGSSQETLPAIYFDEGSTDLSAEALQNLKNIAEKIKSRPYVKIMLEAHADGGNENPTGFLLSQRRGDTVSRYLTSSYKVPLKNMSVHARGSKSPVASNQTETGRKQNRRVEITIIYQQ